MLLIKKIRGGALQYTIVFSMLILLVLFMYLMLVNIQSIELTNAEIRSQLLSNVKSTITILENNPQYFKQDSVAFQLLDNKAFKTNIKFTQWGLYDVVKVDVVHSDMQAVSSLFLFTDHIHENKLLPSLYMSDPSRYLSIGGNTLLGNNTYLPGYGIRKSYVAGVGYYRDSLIYGKSYKALNELPPINQSLLKKVKYLHEFSSNSKSYISIEDINQDSIFNSFNEQTMLIRCPDKYILSNVSLSGNIILMASNLTIKNTCHIDNAIIIANTILIEEEFKGRGQFIAKHHIDIGEDCFFSTPSVLFLEKINANSQINIAAGNLFYGDIIIPKKISSQQHSLKIDLETKIIGQIYCCGQTDFNGLLYGSLYTTGFIKRTSKGLYQNYLVNVCIDVDKLPEEYCGISLTEEANFKTCSEKVF